MTRQQSGRKNKTTNQNGVLGKTSATETRDLFLKALSIEVIIGRYYLTLLSPEGIVLALQQSHYLILMNPIIKHA